MKTCLCFPQLHQASVRALALGGQPSLIKKGQRQGGISTPLSAPVVFLLYDGFSKSALCMFVYNGRYVWCCITVLERVKKNFESQLTLERGWFIVVGMKAVIDYRVGAVYLTPETKKEEAEIYEFYVENEIYAGHFRMSFTTKSVVSDGEEDMKKWKPDLIFTCEEER